MRDAATMVLIRRDGDAPRVLMGQRGAKAAFMPSKFVFPGGALDEADAAPGPETRGDAEMIARLESQAPDGIGRPLLRAAVRETFEETGLLLGAPHDEARAAADTAPPVWAPFYARGLAPALHRLEFIFRAVTPMGRPRRFDARFLMADANAISGPVDDLAGADGELAHLSWLTLAEARALDLPFITRVVLGEVAARLAAPAMRRPAPFFRHDADRSFFDAL